MKNTSDSFREETTRLISDILFTLNKIESHLDSFEIIMNKTSDSFREETTRLISDILFTLNKIESRLDSLENKEELETIAYDDNWLNDLIDEVNAYKGKEE